MIDLLKCKSWNLIYTNVTDDIVYFSLLWFGRLSVSLKKELDILLQNYLTTTHLNWFLYTLLRQDVFFNFNKDICYQLTCELLWSINIVVLNVHHITIGSTIRNVNPQYSVPVVATQEQYSGVCRLLLQHRQ